MSAITDIRFHHASRDLLFVFNPQARDHRVLIFSTSVQSLDILQDYLSYVGINFERLDGSVRGEERFARVSKVH